MSKGMKGLLILLGAIAVGVIFCGVIPWLQVQVLNIPPATLPVIQLPGEHLSANPIISLPGGNDIYLTNTLVATLIADVIVLLLAVLATRKVQMVPKGLQNTMEALLELLYGFAEQVAGPVNARRIFPWMATIFLLLLTANWMELIPGVDSIGILHHAHEGVGGHERAEIGSTGIYYLDVDPDNRQGIDPGTLVVEAEGEEAAEGEHGGEHDLWIVTPFVRAAATDLNLTLALAVTAMVVVQVYGISALGLGYFGKFINLEALASGPMGAIDFAVGLLEIISEFAKIISFAFRLFGNIFAGQILLFVMGFIVPYLIPMVFYGLELFVGAIQAFVFAMLTLVFITMAMISHSHEEHEAH